MNNNTALYFLGYWVICLLITSCNRPPALYQRMPVETFRSTPAPEAKKLVVSPKSIDTTQLTAILREAPLDENAPTEEIYATATSALPVETRNPIRQHLRHVNSLFVNETASSQPAQMQPRPKPKQKKTLREVLGLKPRKKLNWWQRIHWSLKASVVVILVAVLFAVLNVTILAIIFGLLGAFLLIRGLKKEFKVRRPWF
ncbi:hypothetical protein [Tellurirhabdus bombi]|uniref:hypothetical protein n=1 Tax=Tellurirhabdus bombi TaxID=2907205 RepID=UPI001F4059B0|nr:hypothetical protein [Tellurirhabdus bombi]